MRARSYDPQTGRFLSRDTWAIDFENPIELNRYGYAAQNPTNLTDRSGHFSFVEFKANVQKVALAAGTGLAALGQRVAVAVSNLWTGFIDWLNRLFLPLIQSVSDTNPWECFLFEFVTSIDLPYCGTTFGTNPRPTRLVGDDPVDVRGESYITYYHATTATSAENIRNQGIDSAYFRPDADFGRGFYLSRSRETAIWSASGRFPGQPIDVIEFQVPRSRLAGLRTLQFPDESIYWADFVRFHKGLSPDTLAHGGRYFDVVEGPLFRRETSLYPYAVAWPDHTQTSIHTPQAIDLFNHFMLGR